MESVERPWRSVTHPVAIGAAVTALPASFYGLMFGNDLFDAGPAGALLLAGAALAAVAALLSLLSVFAALVGVEGFATVFQCVCRYFAAAATVGLVVGGVVVARDWSTMRFMNDWGALGASIAAAVLGWLALLAAGWSSGRGVGVMSGLGVLLVTVLTGTAATVGFAVASVDPWQPMPGGPSLNAEHVVDDPAGGAQVVARFSLPKNSVLQTVHQGFVVNDENRVTVYDEELSPRWTLDLSGLRPRGGTATTVMTTGDGRSDDIPVRVVVWRGSVSAAYFFDHGRLELKGYGVPAPVADRSPVLEENGYRIVGDRVEEVRTTVREPVADVCPAAEKPVALVAVAQTVVVECSGHSYAMLADA
ncbi:MAG: hypothetical protein QM658_11140 [Gordonia sp. (in: high G+C Gram-positive bacteria)]